MARMNYISPVVVIAAIQPSFAVLPKPLVFTAVTPPGTVDPSKDGEDYPRTFTKLTMQDSAVFGVDRLRKPPSSGSLGGFTAFLYKGDAANPYKHTFKEGTKTWEVSFTPGTYVNLSVGRASTLEFLPPVREEDTRLDAQGQLEVKDPTAPTGWRVVQTGGGGSQIQLLPDGTLKMIV